VADYYPINLDYSEENVGSRNQGAKTVIGEEYQLRPKLPGFSDWLL